MSRTITYFIADLHLGAAYLPDPRANEMRAVHWLESIQDTARSLYLLGDILDYWYEYRNVAPQGHIRFLGQLARLADAGVQITWITGNHDIWIHDYLPKEIGMQATRGPISVTIDGTDFLLDHGDNVGYQRPSYRLMSTLFHSKLCQRLYASLHPRYTTALATGWSRQNRVRRNPDQNQRDISASLTHLRQFCQAHSLQHPNTRHYIFGHLHTQHQSATATGALITVLPSCITQGAYASFDGHTLRLHQLPPL